MASARTKLGSAAIVQQTTAPVHIVAARVPTLNSAACLGKRSRVENALMKQGTHRPKSYVKALENFLKHFAHSAPSSRQPQCSPQLQRGRPTSAQAVVFNRARLA